MTSFPWRRLWKVGKPFWVSDQRFSALLHLGGVLALLGTNSIAAYFTNIVAGRWTTAFEAKNQPDFYFYLLIYAGVIIVGKTNQVLYDNLRTRLAIVWRLWMSSSMFTWYYSNLAFYKLTRDTDVDNPDQRMTQDNDSFCNSFVGLFISILDALVNIVMFAGLLYALSPDCTWAVIAYSGLGTLVVVMIGKSLSALNFLQMKTEADLRFALAETRREAELIAFSHGQELAKLIANKGLQAVIATLLAIMRVNRRIQLFTSSYNELVPLIPAYLIAPRYFDGLIPFGYVTQATMAFCKVFNGATLFIGQFGGISAFATTVNRLGAFVEAVEASCAEELPPGKLIKVTEGPDIIFDKMSLLTLDLTRVLIADLSVKVIAGDSLLIVGPDGAGKTALLRTVAGLWAGGAGSLQRPAASETRYITQNPYLPPTTLRQALSCPCTIECPDDARLLQILRTVGLCDLATRAGGLDTVQKWREFLSLGEQQKLNLASVILSKPKFAIIDDATMVLEDQNESLLFSLLSSLGTTLLSAGPAASATLVKYHRRVLQLFGDGTWKVYDASDYLAGKFSAEGSEESKK